MRPLVLPCGAFSLVYQQNGGWTDEGAGVICPKVDVIRAQTAFDEKLKAANPKNIGHVTLLR